MYDRIVDRVDALVERALEEPTGWETIVFYVDGVIGMTAEPLSIDQLRAMSAPRTSPSSDSRP